jgi:hypothetical protein
VVHGEAVLTSAQAVLTHGEDRRANRNRGHHYRYG